MTQNALVMFSGGQDSATCLAWALENYSCVETVGFTYHQKHSVELKCRKSVLQKIGPDQTGQKGLLMIMLLIYQSFQNLAKVRLQGIWKLK